MGIFGNFLATLDDDISGKFNKSSHSYFGKKKLMTANFLQNDKLLTFTKYIREEGLSDRHTRGEQTKVEVEQVCAVVVKQTFVELLQPQHRSSKDGYFVQ
ncbi:hypothetical protein LOAG_01747 [Loa loa]|uniref:Uncharacterized protein n=1 Tax=Loa loa TaxID=7209 RepID=A0A1S0UA89_LOALO|nr:hypothetical protein LOAG_01747 [Loa loa]EFO26731.1 hypothetical protein LOAG_01747 [Loa loa]